MRRAIEVGFGGATRRPRGGVSNYQVEWVERRAWKRGDVCAARIIGRQRSPVLIIDVKSGHAVFYLLELRKGRNGREIWTFADVMEPSRKPFDELKPVEEVPHIANSLNKNPVTEERIQTLLDASSAWYSQGGYR